MADKQAITETMELAFRAMDELCSSLAPDDWTKPTDCPGWSVQDQLSHQNGIESSLLGRPAPDHKATGPLAEKGTERDVDYRRSWPPDKVLAEYRDVIAERIRALRAMTDEEFNKEGFSPTGRGGYAEFMAVRIFDCWMHEQDIRCAIQKRGNLVGPVARFVFGRCVMTMPMIVGKRVAPPDGTIVVFDVSGETIAIAVQDGRARQLDQAPASATVRLTMDLHALTRLAGGRRTLEQLGDHVTIDGDRTLGGRVLESMTFTP